MNLYRIRNTIYAGLVSSVLIGCSGDDSSGPAAPVNASIDSDKTVALATAGTEAVKQGVNSDSANIFGARLAGKDPLKQLSAATAQAAPMAQEIPNFCESGSVDQVATQTSGTITYNDCVIAGATFNGSATFTSSTSNNVTTFTITYIDFTLEYNGETTTKFTLSRVFRKAL